MMKKSLPILTLCLLPMAAFGDESDWAEGDGSVGNNGATKDYYNATGRLRWKNPLGDWHDAKNVAQGDAPYAVAIPTKGGEAVEWDVTSLVQEWVGGTHLNQGFFLKASEGGSASFVSRQGPEEASRPQLVVVSAGKTVTLPAVADTHLARSTTRSLGQSPTLSINADDQRALLRFELGDLKAVTKATLRLVPARVSGKVPVGVFRCSQTHRLPPSDPIPGLAAKYPGDRGIEKDPDVVFATGFEAEEWKSEWSHAGGKLDTLDADPDRAFEPFMGKALRGTMLQGGNGCMNVRYLFKDKKGSEPEEIYFRYYLRLGSTWNQTVDGGKMPGMAGRYGKAGNGGAKSDGYNGWSTRGSFYPSPSAANPLAGLHPIGTYCYHADQKGPFGDGIGWDMDYRGFVRANRWYCVETYVKMNSIDGKEGRRDGILRGWVDGRLAVDRTNLRFRHVDSLKIEEIWLNVYHGGTAPCPHEQHMYIDNIVVSKKYIGPIAR
jgi:hypothetical protein